MLELAGWVANWFSFVGFNTLPYPTRRRQDNTTATRTFGSSAVTTAWSMVTAVSINRCFSSQSEWLASRWANVSTLREANCNNKDPKKRWTAECDDVTPERNCWLNLRAEEDIIHECICVDSNGSKGDTRRSVRCFPAEWTFAQLRRHRRGGYCAPSE